MSELLLLTHLANIELSEDMSKDGYSNISNMDISRVVLEKMKDHYSTQAKVKKHNF